MTLQVLTTTYLPLIIVLVGGVISHVRLEGIVRAQERRLATLEDQAKASEETKIEVVRLQEQIKHLSGLLERYLLPDRNGSESSYGR